MKKLISSNHASSHKLALRSETVRVLRQLSLRELRDARVVGGTADNCDESTMTQFTTTCP